MQLPDRLPQSSRLRLAPRHSLRRRFAGALLLCLTAAVARAAAPGTEPSQPNVLEARADVANMVDESVQMLEPKVSMVGVEGWAVFSSTPVTASLEPGVGMAERADGNTWFMRMRNPSACLSSGHREVLVFRDKDAFREFRDGQLQGPQLAKLTQLTAENQKAPVVAFQFRPAAKGELELQAVDLGQCRFALHKDLQRALVAEPTSTKQMYGKDQQSDQ